jgi:hypothetical protein
VGNLLVRQKDRISSSSVRRKGVFFIGAAYVLLGLLIIFWPEIEFIHLNNSELKLSYELTWNKRSFYIPASSIQAVKLAPSPLTTVMGGGGGDCSANKSKGR